MPRFAVNKRYFYGKRVRNTIGRMESPRRELSFEQLKIYYETRSLHLNDAFMKNLELLTPENKPNYAAYLLADENGVSLQIAKYAGIDRVDLIENRDYGRCSLIKALKSLLDRIAVENTVFTKITYPLRQEQELINSIAIREAIINAVVHNDYSYGASLATDHYSWATSTTIAFSSFSYWKANKMLFYQFLILTPPREKENTSLKRLFGSDLARIMHECCRALACLCVNARRQACSFARNEPLLPQGILSCASAIHLIKRP